jgi:Holliday junction DNA helicase RuvA|tara:strand:- start:3169 stop:3750 length:582 start_codon:yes stop_codon:yes gene_type:complete
MITHIKGKLVEKNPSFVVVDCNGIGYMIRISLHTFSQISDSELCNLFTHLSVKEDSHTLYGFFEKAERELFRLLISVSGVGTNTAQTILSSLSPLDAQLAILSENVAALQSVKGIGAKTAQRIILDLKDKIAKQGISGEESSIMHNTTRDEALSALTMLGFSKNIVNKAIDRELKNQSNLEVEELVKRVLKNL